MSGRLQAARNVAKAVVLLGLVVAAWTAFGYWLGGFRLASVFFVTAGAALSTEVSGSAVIASRRVLR